MSVILPSTIALKSSWFNYYVQYSSDSDAEQDRGLIRVNGRNVFSSLAKFEVVTASTGTGLVHIRCPHNKKFIRKVSDGKWDLSPEADEPEEDQSKWSCTLFEPQIAVDGKPDQVRLFHVHTKRYAHAYDEGKIRYWALYGTRHGQNIYDIIDLETLVILPKYVAFKGDNGLYLQHADSNQLRFISPDKGIAESGFEVSTDGDGKVKIKVFNSLNNNFMRFEGQGTDNSILADGDITSGSNPPSEFWPVKIDASTVALKCLSNNDKFCTRFTHSISDGLSVRDTSSTISLFARLRLEELVLSRTIYNTDFNLKDAIIYGETPVTMATANANNSTSVDNTVEFTFTYKDSKSSTWSASHAWMVGVSATVDFKVPFIGGGGSVTAKAEYSGSYEWGETVTSENTLQTTYKVTVPAHTSISVSLMATKGKCDVPYSYYQKDVLYNGKTVIYKKDDGLYTGINSYDFHYDVTAPKVPEPDSKPNSINKMKRYSAPPIFSSKQQMIPTPVPYGSYGLTSVQTPITTTMLEQEFSPQPMTSSAVKS